MSTTIYLSYVKCKGANNNKISLKGFIHMYRIIFKNSFITYYQSLNLLLQKYNSRYIRYTSLICLNFYIK